MFWTELRGLLARRRLGRRLLPLFPLIIATIALAIQLLAAGSYWADWYDLYPYEPGVKFFRATRQKILQAD
jgi:hypothetical protein